MKSEQINEFVIGKAHCDWVIDQTRELKALLSFGSKTMIRLNKNRALSAISTAKDSLEELRLYLEDI